MKYEIRRRIDLKQRCDVKNWPDLIWNGTKKVIEKRWFMFRFIHSDKAYESEIGVSWMCARSFINVSIVVDTNVIQRITILQTEAYTCTYVKISFRN